MHDHMNVIGYITFNSSESPPLLPNNLSVTSYRLFLQFHAIYDTVYKVFVTCLCLWFSTWRRLQQTDECSPQIPSLFQTYFNNNPFTRRSSKLCFPLTTPDKIAANLCQPLCDKPLSPSVTAIQALQSTSIHITTWMWIQRLQESELR
jgi:hypothetical protein